MARVKIADLPVLEEMGPEELQRLYGEGLFPGGRLRELTAAVVLGLGLSASPTAFGGQGNSGGHGHSGHGHGHAATHHRTTHGGRGGVHRTTHRTTTHRTVHRTVHHNAPRRVARVGPNWHRHWNASHRTWVYDDPQYGATYWWNPAANAYVILEE
jgi:hypothetical protein